VGPRTLYGRRGFPVWVTFFTPIVTFKPGIQGLWARLVGQGRELFGVFTIGGWQIGDVFGEI